MSLSSELHIEIAFHAEDGKSVSLTLEAGDLTYFADETKSLLAATLREGDEDALLAWWQRFDNCVPDSTNALEALGALGGLRCVTQTDVTVNYVNNYEPSMSCNDSYSFGRDGSPISTQSSADACEWYDHDLDPDGASKVGIELYAEEDFAFVESFCGHKGIPFDWDINDRLWINISHLDELFAAFVDNDVEYDLVVD